MARPACQHGVPLIFDCPDCIEDMEADEYLAEAYSDHTPRLEHWEWAGIVPLNRAVTHGDFVRAMGVSGYAGLFEW